MNLINTYAKQEQKSILKNDCEKFLDSYEKWADEVIKVYKKAQENPLDIENTKKMMESTQKMSEWSQKWSKLYDCADNEKYAKRMEEIQKKIEQQMQ